MDYYKAYNREFGYNISPSAYRTTMSQETKEKIINTRINKYKNIHGPTYGMRHTEETKKKSVMLKGVKTKNRSLMNTKKK